MSIPTWLSVATYNRLDGSYINGDCDVTGNVIVRGTNSIWMDSNVSLKLNSATVVTLSIAELASLDGITGGTIVSQLSALQTKTQNISASTSVLTTFEDSIILTAGNLTLTLGNLILSSGDLSVVSGKSILNNGTLDFGTTGLIRVNAVDITNAEIGYLTGLTSSVETRITNNATDILNLQDKTSGINYSSGDTTIGGTLYVFKTVVLPPPSPPLLIPVSVNGLFTDFDTLTGQVNTLNTNTTGITYDSALDKTTIDNDLEITGDITANAQTVTQTNLGHISGLSSNANTSISNLNTKTANMTASGAVTTYTGTHTFNSTVQVSTGRTFQINGTSRIFLNGTSSYLEMGTSKGILATGDIATGIFITGTEMSYLNNASSNLQDQIGDINTSLTDLVLNTTDITYTAVPPTTSVANAVSLTGSLKVAQQAWLEGPIKLKTTYVAPVSGELGYTTTANLASQITTFVNSTAKNIVSFTLPIGVWLITYNVLTNLVGGTFSSIFIGINTTSNAIANNLVSQINQPNIPYTSEIRFSTSRVVNVSTSTTYYLTGYFSFTGSSPAVNTPTYLEATRIA